MLEIGCDVIDDLELLGGEPMRGRNVLMISLLLVGAVLTSGTALASDNLQPAGCTQGAAYDPACDVNHDGMVDVLDIQLTAGHWNQTGTWTGGDGWLLPLSMPEKKPSSALPHHLYL